MCVCAENVVSVAEVPTYGGRVGQLGNLFSQAVLEAVGDSREDPGHDREWRFLLGKSSLRCRVGLGTYKFIQEKRHGSLTPGQ
jgi:hypothetical protein